MLLADDTGAVYGMRRNALTQRFLLRHAFTGPLTNARLELSPASSVSSRIYFHQQRKGDDDDGPITGRAVIYHSTERNNNHENRNENVCAFWLFVRTIFYECYRNGRKDVRCMWIFIPLKILAIRN